MNFRNVSHWKCDFLPRSLKLFSLCFVVGGWGSPSSRAKGRPGKECEQFPAEQQTIESASIAVNSRKRMRENERLCKHGRVL